MGEENPDRRPFDPPRSVKVLHDDGHWYRGMQFEWVRCPMTQAWRAGVTYSTAPGAQYVRSVPADRLIASLRGSHG
jgi:hypothetical protein